MSDHELLELAAKAAGIRYDAEKSLPVEGRKWWGLWLSFVDEPGEFARRHWNPLTDDGDALRLAVAANQLNILHLLDLYGDPVLYKADPTAATRRAIVRAAAEIGKAMQ